MHKSSSAIFFFLQKNVHFHKKRSPFQYYNTEIKLYITIYRTAFKNVHNVHIIYYYRNTKLQKI